MNYNINYKVSGDLLRVSLTGTGGSANLAAISADVDKLVKKYGVSLILVDLRGADSQLGIFESIKHIEKYPPEMRDRKYAIVDKTENRSQNSFFENAAVNRGYQIYFFYNEAEALKWLNVTTDTVPEFEMEREY